MTESVAEKVIRLETQMSNVTSEIAEVKSLVKEVIVKVDNFTTLQLEIVTLKGEIADLHRGLIDLKAKAFRNGWLFPTLSAAAGIVIALLVENYISHIGH